AQGIYESEEMKLVEPLLRLQETWSKIPDEKSVLVEHMHSREGYHLFIYPFEGRLVHEGLAALLAYRMSRLMPATFSLSINDYGFEMVSNINVPVEMLSEHHLFNPENLADDILRSMNASEMARRHLPANTNLSPGRRRAMNDSSNEPMRSPLMKTTFMLSSLVMVPIDMRCRCLMESLSTMK
ncbi:MAG TPA: hypothetical protein EYN91_27285, partial [Candidatus Melainabacteria bacterium]|nr:hypothetical protein [Candidatus Melainabacteria bacterium]